MPRQDRASAPMHRGSGAICHSSRQKGGTTRRTRGPKNTYDPAYRRADWNLQPTGVLTAPVVVEMSRHNGSSTAPQAPKGGKGRPVPSVPNPKKSSPKTPAK